SADPPPPSPPPRATDVPPEDARIRRDPDRGQAVQVAALALDRGPDRVQVAQEGDLSMPVQREVANRPGCAGAVVDGYGVGRRDRRRAVEEDDGQARAAPLHEEGDLAETGGDHHQAVDLARGEGRQDLSLPLRVLVAAAGEDHDVPPVS